MRTRNRKNDLVNHVMADVGVEPYEGTAIHPSAPPQWVQNCRCHLESNCTAVLKAAKLDDFFEVQVDGNTIHAQRLAGKPAPDTFLMAAKLLGLSRYGPLSSRMPSLESRPALMDTSDL